MPGPGNSSYDRDRAQLRKELLDQGLSDDEAERQAAEQLQEGLVPRTEDDLPDRALGPKSER